jgi:hypothetical protein
VVGAHAPRVRNEDEGRVLLTMNVAVGRFRTLTEDEQDEFLVRFKAAAR